MVTIFNGVTDKTPHYISLQKALDRIRDGKSKASIELLRSEKDDEEQQKLKKALPAVCFSGKFTDRTDKSMESHSGFIVLDFDYVKNVEESKRKMSENEYCFAVWISPRGNGLKMLVRIADTAKHKEHFDAIADEMGNVDPSGRNPARLCFESYDPEIYINKEAKIWTKCMTIKRETTRDSNIVSHDEYENFNRLLSWMTSNGKVFKTGERNTFVYVLASACCRFGISQSFAESALLGYSLSESGFTAKECIQAVRSAYRTNAASAGTAYFEQGKLVDKNTKSVYDVEIKQEDIDKIISEGYTSASSVKKEVDDIYNVGFTKVKPINVPLIDKHFKMMRKQLVVLSGYGNMGKSTYWRWYLLMRAIIFGEKFAIFGPEDNPAEYFYFDLTEMMCGCSCSFGSPTRPSKPKFDASYKFVSDHFFYVCPTVHSPTPQHIKEIFLGLIIKHGVDGVVIDPFNQLDNDYGGRSDKYLESCLRDLHMFSINNNVYMNIICHPSKPKAKDNSGNYPRPTEYELADGAMWANKADAILIYHRPYGWSDPHNNTCELESRKIRNQKIVGQKGTFEFEYDRNSRRYLFAGVDHMAQALKDMEGQVELVFEEKTPMALRPNVDFWDNPRNEYGQERSDHPSDENQDLF